MINTNTLNMPYNLCLKFKLITLWILTFTFIVIWVNKAYVLGNNEGNSANIFLLKNWCPYQVYPIFQHNEGHNFIFVVLITSLFQIWEDQISWSVFGAIWLIKIVEDVTLILGERKINQKTMRNETGPKESVRIFILEKNSSYKNE